MNGRSSRSRRRRGNGGDPDDGGDDPDGPSGSQKSSDDEEVKLQIAKRAISQLGLARHKEADKITIRSIPSDASGIFAWRLQLESAVVAASGRPNLAYDWIRKVDSCSREGFDELVPRTEWESLDVSSPLRSLNRPRATCRTASSSSRRDSVRMVSACTGVRSFG